MHREIDMPIVNKLFYRENHAFICSTIMIAFVLNAMTTNATFQSTLSNVIVTNNGSYSLEYDGAPWTVTIATSCG